MVETIRQLLEDNRAQQETMIMAFVDFLKNWQPEIKVETPAPVEIQREQAVFNFQNENERTIQRKKPSKKLAAAIAWMLENDPNLQLKTDEVSNAVGVSFGTVDNARKAIRSGEYQEYL